MPSRLLRIPLLLLAAALTGAAVLAPGGESGRKDKAAVLIHGGIIDAPVLITRRDTANLFDIVLTRIRGEAVRPEDLVGRPCLGLAIFTITEWDVLTAEGIPETVDPQRARSRIRLYPAIGDRPAVVHAPHVPTGPPAWQLMPQVMDVKLRVPLRVPADTEPRCDVEV
jgi:hypothetical protein